MTPKTLRPMIDAVLWLRRRMGRPQGLALMSAGMLGAYGLGGAGAMAAVGVAVPAGLALWQAAGLERRLQGLDDVTGLPLRPAALSALDATLIEAPAQGRSAACLVLEIDDFAELARRHGSAGCDRLLSRLGERLRATVREGDVVARIGRARFAVMPSGLRGPALETAIQLGTRLQAAVAKPLMLEGVRLYVTACAGFALPGPGLESAGALVAAAEGALIEAQRQGPGALRGHSGASRRPASDDRRPDLAAEVGAALDEGRIHAWFQPQVSTDTGEILGMEALARWDHPRRGIMAPGEFMPAVVAAGEMPRLGSAILDCALAALKDWDARGLKVPVVGINVSGEDLSDPQLCERLKWELDRFGLEPGRIAVEILETVLMPSGDDIVSRNVARLSEMGVGLDLDDFGTGTASIAAIRRFDVHRIKIDRSFVSHVDRDRGQQDMVAAILSMAERLGLRTLAEGVETPGEHAMLAQLGCEAVQGFGIGRPMPLGATYGWIARQDERVQAALGLGRRVG